MKCKGKKTQIFLLLGVAKHRHHPPSPPQSVFLFLPHLPILHSFVLNPPSQALLLPRNRLPFANNLSVMHFSLLTPIVAVRL